MPAGRHGGVVYRPLALGCLDIALDQLGPFRPTKLLGRWRTPITGLYISGAGTNPSGGIAGTPGRQAARARLHDHP